MTQLETELASVLDDPQLDDADKIEAVRRTVESRRTLSGAENAQAIEETFGSRPTSSQPSSSVGSSTGADDKWLTPGEAAEYANVCGMTMWRWRHHRGLKFAKIGGLVRIRSSELQKFMDMHMPD